MNIIDALTAAIADAAATAEGDIAIRVLHDDEAPIVGQIMADSHVWEDDVRTDISIGGTAAFHRDYVQEAVKYSHSKRFAILSGQDIGYAGMPERGAHAYRNATVVSILTF